MSDASAPRDATSALLDLALEGWRFQRLFSRALQKLEVVEAARFSNQHRHFVRRVGECLDEIGIRFVTPDGPYDPGDAVTAVNVEDFESDEELVVDQVIEPIVMGPSGLVRPGTVTLRKASK